ncbi:MAG: serine hydrolase domain-containing protein [Alkalispirochaetaceae bacterium]
MTAIRRQASGSPESAQASLDRAISSLRRRSREFAFAGMTVSAPSVGLNCALGADAEASNALFHTASVGKLFTTALIGMLMDEGRLSRETVVAEILPAHLLDGLFLLEGTDYRDRVTVAQLLSHTSGVADYFDGPVVTGGRRNRKETVAVMASREQNRRWSPEELLAWSRERQRPVAPPGERFYYSDTGFVLLGFLVEEIERVPFHEALAKRVFEPLQMVHASMPGRSLPADPETPPMRPLWLRGTELSRAQSVTVDWTGGGVAATAEELVRFARAFHDGTLLSADTLSWLQQFNWKFRRGIAYGHGVMEMRFGEFFPLLRSLPNMSGHMGITGVELFMDTEDGTVVSVSTGTTRAISQSVRLLISAVSAVQKLKR